MKQTFPCVEAPIVEGVLSYLEVEDFGVKMSSSCFDASWMMLATLMLSVAFRFIFTTFFSLEGSILEISLLFMGGDICFFASMSRGFVRDSSELSIISLATFEAYPPKLESSDE